MIFAGLVAETIADALNPKDVYNLDIELPRTRSRPTLTRSTTTSGGVRDQGRRTSLLLSPPSFLCKTLIGAQDKVAEVEGTRPTSLSEVLAWLALGGQRHHHDEV